MQKIGPIVKRGFLGGSVAKNPSVNARDIGSIPRLRRSLGEGNGNNLQYSCLGNPLDRGAGKATVHLVTESDSTEELNTHIVKNTQKIPCV